MTAPRRVRWLGVDTDDCVGIFDVEVASRAPQHATHWVHPPDARPDWSLQLARVGRALDEDRDALSGASSGRFVLGTERALVVFAADLEASAAYRANVRAGEAERALGEVRIVREGAPRVLATTRPLGSELAELLAGEPHVARWLLEDDLFEVLASTLRTGVFHWTCSDPMSPSAYERTASPARPLRASELDPQARARVEKARIPAVFGASRRLTLPPRGRKR
jgi:hypothetical protein